MNTNMKRLMGLLALVFAVAAQSAAGEESDEGDGWADNQIQDIIDDVRDIKDQVTGDGNIKVVADDLRSQLQMMQAEGLLLRESVDDVFMWLQERRGPLQAFVGSSPRCGPATECGQFREELKRFIVDFAAMRGNFPAIERFGLGDGSRAVHAIEITPPIMLFGVHEVLGHTDDWRNIPADLEQLFDEIGDPEVFSDGLSPFSSGTVGALAIGRASSPLGVFDQTPTQRFCARHEDRLEREIDPVRLNRLQFFVFYLETALKLIESLTSETIGGTVVGEGTETLIPNPLKAQLKLVISAVEIIQRGVGTFRANLDICRNQRRQLEFQVAQCIELVDFVKPTKRDEVFQLVVDIVEKSEEEGVSVQNARKSLERAESHRDAEKWKEAYRSLCDAYRKIGA